MAQPSRTGEELIQDLAEVLEIPASRYESADRSYRSVSRWLDRPESRFADVNLDVYTQGSFRLGTAIRPLNGEEHYDLDIVCEFRISKAHTTQKQLYDDLGHELELYAAKHGMQEPSSWQRCWTLNYADEAQFHMDVLPSVPDAQRQRVLREARSLPLDYVDKSVSITDTEHANFRRFSDEWPASNPNGYADWFQSRMKPAFESRRRAMMLADSALGHRRDRGGDRDAGWFPPPDTYERRCACSTRCQAALRCADRRASPISRLLAGREHRRSGHGGAEPAGWI